MPKLVKSANIITLCPGGGIGRPTCRQAGAQIIIKYMIFYVYAIKSIKYNYIYVGLSNNYKRRIDEHNKGKE